MEHADSHLQVRNSSLKRILEQPVLIAWDDTHSGRRQHLGRVFPSDKPDTAKLTLQFARDEAANQALISFHLPLTLRPAQRKKPKHVFIVVPAEHALVTTAVIDSAKIPFTTVRQLENHNEGSSVFFRLRFTLEKTAFVVMPVLERPLSRPLQGAPRQLATLLKSLTETNEFEVYLAHTQEVAGARWELGDSITPHLDLDSTYGRGCTGAKNIWNQYPCEALALQRYSWNPFVDDNPPTYDEAVPAPQDRVEPASPLQLSPSFVPAQNHLELGSYVLTWNDALDVGPPPVSRDPHLRQEIVSSKVRFRPLGDPDPDANNDGHMIPLPPTMGTPTEKDSTDSTREEPCA